jgi:hypothetical protein
VNDPGRAEAQDAAARRCRGCDAPTDRLRPVVDFGLHPHASSFPLPGEVGAGEPSWPLLVVICESCWLVQLAGDAPEEPAVWGPAPWTTADSLERQARGLARVAANHVRGDADEGPIVEVASHGNYLQSLLRETGQQSIIVERSESLAASARMAGIGVTSRDVASPGGLKDLAGRVSMFVDHYALAHHPAPGRAVAGIARLLAPDGWAVFEFDSILPSLEKGEFDGFRHGHFAYLSLLSLTGLLERHGLVPVEATTHAVYGGVLRVFVRRADDGARPDSSVDALLAAERRAGLDRASSYRRFESAVATTCAKLRRLVDVERAAGGRVAAYGAPSRGNTLLNACRIGTDRLEFTVDRSTWKQGRLMPGSGLPIRQPDALRDGISLVVILTWDIAEEVAKTLAAQPGPPLRLAVPFPEVRLLPGRARGAG